VKRTVVVSAVIAAMLAGCSSLSGSARYKVTITAAHPYSRSVVGVAFNVENTGTAVGQPSCMVIAASSSTNGGIKRVVLASIGPGHRDYEAATDDRVTIIGGTAALITSPKNNVLVTCT